VDRLDNTNKRFETLADQRGIALSDLKAQSKPVHSSNGSDDYLDNEDDEIILEFETEDKKIDMQLDELINGIEGLGIKAKRMNEGLAEVEQRQDRAKAEIGKANQDLEKKNAQLKELLKHFGQGTNCCMTVFLLLLLIGLVVVLVNLALKLRK
jgi:hypothetical protein